MDGGGALMNQSVHYADLVCWLCGQPEVLSAHCATVAHDIEVEDLALALLRFEDGALGMFEASTVAFPGFPTTLRVSGTEGTIVLENGALVAAALQDGDESVTEGDVSALGFPGGHRAQLADITSAIVEGRPQSVSGEDGYRALKLVLDVYEAAGCGPS
jgi:predicted dehydrogenase